MNTYKIIRAGETCFIVASSRNAATQKLLALNWKKAIDLGQIKSIVKV